MKKLVFISILLGLGVSSTILYVAFQHNPQGEFYNFSDGTIDFHYSFLLGGVWFIVLFMVFLCLGAMGIFIIKKIKKWISK